MVKIYLISGIYIIRTLYRVYTPPRYARTNNNNKIQYYSNVLDCGTSRVIVTHITVYRSPGMAKPGSIPVDAESGDRHSRPVFRCPRNYPIYIIYLYISGVLDEPCIRVYCYKLSQIYLIGRYICTYICVVCVAGH